MEGKTEEIYNGNQGKHLANFGTETWFLSICSICKSRRTITLKFLVLRVEGGQGSALGEQGTGSDHAE